MGWAKLEGRGTQALWRHLPFQPAPAGLSLAERLQGFGPLALPNRTDCRLHHSPPSDWGLRIERGHSKRTPETSQQGAVKRVQGERPRQTASCRAHADCLAYALARHALCTHTHTHLHCTNMQETCTRYCDHCAIAPSNPRPLCVARYGSKALPKPKRDRRVMSGLETPSCPRTLDSLCPLRLLQRICFNVKEKQLFSGAHSRRPGLACPSRWYWCWYPSASEHGVVS